MTFIPRDFNRTESDDYILNVQSHLERNKLKESVRIYSPVETNGENVINPTRICLGWKIQYKYE